MNKNLLIAVISVLLFACEKEKPKTYPENILAGQISGPGILYTDLEPNEPLVYSVIKRLDINRDGVNDFELKTYSFQQPGFGAGYLTIKPLNLNEIAAPLSDNTCVDTLLINSLIDKNLNWHSSATDLYSSSYNYNSRIFHGFWKIGNNLKDKCVGVKINVGGNILYGWIRMDYIVQDGFLYLMILDYACTTGIE
jgi:hypothetical protein